MIRAPSISTVMMQKPLTKATEATTGRGKGEDDPPFTMNFLPMNERADKLSDHANQWNDVRVLEAHEPTDAGKRGHKVYADCGTDARAAPIRDWGGPGKGVEGR